MDSKDHTNDQDDQNELKRTRLTAQNHRSVIDQQLARAEANGLMNKLPGAGKRQRFDDEGNVPEEDRIGYRMLKGSGFSLPWLEERRDIDEEHRRLDAWRVHANDRWPHLSPEARERTRAEYRKKLEALNSQILTHNLRIPPSVGQLRGIQIHEELRKLGE